MKYIIYCRKSSESEDKQEQSIESQERELIAIAEKQNLQVVKILKESQSAKKIGRPVFSELLSLVASGKADAVLCWKLDRLSRNPIDTGHVQSLLQDNIIKNIKTFERDYYPQDNILMMVFEMGMANQYIRDLSTNVKRGNREKLTQGGWPGPAPFGYKNDKAEKTIVKDPIKSKYVSRIFELYLLGTYSLRDISNILFNENIRTATNKKISKSNIQKIISNPFYTGLMLREGKLYQGKHEAIISMNIFDQAQERLVGKSRPRSQKLFFPLRGFMKCENCLYLLTASVKKNHDYYYCTNGKHYCSEHKSYMRENYLYGKIEELLTKLHFSKSKIEIIYKAVQEKLGHQESIEKQKLETLHKELESLKTRENKLLDIFLADQIEKPVYDAKLIEIKNRLVEVNKKIISFKIVNPLSTLEPTKNAFLQGHNVSDEFINATKEQKKKILEKVLWNLTIKDKNIVSYQFKSPYDILARTPKNATFETMLPSKDSNLN